MEMEMYATWTHLLLACCALLAFTGVTPVRAEWEVSGPLPNGATTAIQLQVKGGWLDFGFGLCDNTTCSVFACSGVDGDGLMGYELYAGRNDQMMSKIRTVRAYEGPRRFPNATTYVFMLHRVAATNLKVWLKQNPAKVVDMEVSASQATIRGIADAGPIEFVPGGVHPGPYPSSGGSRSSFSLYASTAPLLVIMFVGRGRR